MNRYFGEKMDAPAWEQMEPCDVPLGMGCTWCREPFVAGDAGVAAPDGVTFAWHVECWMRQFLGGLNHMLGRCCCCGDGDEPPDPPGMSKREAALAAVRFARQRQNAAAN